MSSSFSSMNALAHAARAARSRSCLESLESIVALCLMQRVGWRALRGNYVLVLRDHCVTACCCADLPLCVYKYKQRPGKVSKTRAVLAVFPKRHTPPSWLFSRAPEPSVEQSDSSSVTGFRVLSSAKNALKTHHTAVILTDRELNSAANCQSECSAGAAVQRANIAAKTQPIQAQAKAPFQCKLH